MFNPVVNATTGSEVTVEANSLPAADFSEKIKGSSSELNLMYKSSLRVFSTSSDTTNSYIPRYCTGASVYINYGHHPCTDSNTVVIYPVVDYSSSKTGVCTHWLWNQINKSIVD
jgi:hypothetical protein